MLNDATGFSHIYLACGYTDLRRGIDGLVSTVKCSFHLNPSEEGSIFLFCGAEGVQTGSRLWFTKAMDFCCCTNGWQMADFSGHGAETKCNK